MTLPDDVQVVLLALGWSGAAGALGLLVIRRLPRRSVRLDLAAVAAVAVVSLLAGVTGAARAMFLSVHDLTVVVTVALVAAPVALAVALLAGRTVVRDVDRVRERAAALADETPAGRAGPPAPQLRELAALDDDLADVGARLSGARARQEALERSRRELVAWVSHDLRTPLAALRATVEALEDGLAPDPARARRQVLREVDRLASLVDDLRELSGIQAGALPLHPEPVDLRDVARDAVEAVAAPAAARGVLLDPVEAPPRPVTVLADAGTLARVAGNLLANAVRYSRPGGTVRVTVAPRDGGGVLAVRDACGGIPEADRERVFEPGWRAEGARTPGPDGGSGLGLAVARGLARANGGDVVLGDAEGGCRFEVVLPGAPSGGASAAPVRPASPR